MTAVIRRAEPNDTARLGELHAGCWRQLYTGVLPADVLDELGPETMIHLWSKFVGRGGDYLQYVAEVDGEIVGFAGFGPGRDPGLDQERELYFISVLPAYTRQGIGRQLSDAVGPASYVWLWDRNRDAVAFYRRTGFRPDSQRRRGSLFGTELLEVRLTREPKPAAGITA
jgi:GNAT superfamily N-acetyltransferase